MTIFSYDCYSDVRDSLLNVEKYPQHSCQYMYHIPT